MGPKYFPTRNFIVPKSIPRYPFKSSNTHFQGPSPSHVFFNHHHHHHHRSNLQLSLYHLSSLLRLLFPLLRPQISLMATESSSPGDATNYGFDRSEMYSSSLADTVEPYDRHVFLFYKSYDAWPSRVENSDSDPLPKLLNSVIKARKDDLPLKTRLTICGSNGVEGSDGDVLIFPEMVKYRGLKESNVEEFVDDVLVNGKPWASGLPENLTGTYIFVCAHGSRDKRCGVCGPILIEKFKEDIESRRLNDQAFVNACSHVGGHKYAGNVIIFNTNDEGKVVGDWYGYVTPADVPALLDAHIGKREVIEKLWRGQMGLEIQGVESVQKKTLPEANVPVPAETEGKQRTIETEGKQESSFSCCQGASGVTCCRDNSMGVNGEVADMKPKTTSEETCKFGGVSLPSWMGKWEQSDVLMVAGVVGAVATVAVAYSIYRRSA